MAPACIPRTLYLLKSHFRCFLCPLDNIGLRLVIHFWHKEADLCAKEPNYSLSKK